MDNSAINRCLMRFEDRAERITDKQIAETFVSIGPLVDLLDSKNNQIMYGRRGTGKTHALRYFQSKRVINGDLAVYIDAQRLGSNGSIYMDGDLPVSERASRLLVDICSAIHHELLETFTDPHKGWDMSQAVLVLDHFVDSFMETRISGSVESEINEKLGSNQKLGGELGFKIASGGISASPKIYSENSQHAEAEKSKKQIGTEETWIDFTYFSRAITALSRFIGDKRLWLLIDEWTTIPPELQPYLADLIRRSMFSIRNISVKIAAIEHRSVFKLDRPDEGYIGFELGADISAAINLDDYLVIDNDEVRAKQFFRTFLKNHGLAAANELGLDLDPNFVSYAFTQDNVFTEFVRASEGVPRDAMYILTLAAQKANNTPITMPIIRNSAYTFFITDKYSTIKASPANRILLDWIRDEVISQRKTRAFLLPVSTEDIIIDRLFDRRALHILNRSRSAAHRPGERFVVYKLDYGLYVDLIATDNFPRHLLVESCEGDELEFDVPLDDARSYRRAILDLDKFYNAHPDLATD